MAQFAFDTFTDTDGTALESHTADDGGTWTEHTLYTTGAMVISDANRARRSIGNNTCYYHSGAPASANYYVQCNVHQLSSVSQQGIAGRIDTVLDTMYYARHNTAFERWDLRKLVAGVDSALGNFSQTLSNGVTYTAILKMDGDQISLYVDGVLRVGPITDSDISAAGKAGFRISGATGETNSTGKHLDNFLAVDLTGWGPLIGGERNQLVLAA